MLRQDSLQISDVSWLAEPAHINPSSLRGASWCQLVNNTDGITFIGNERRGNLPSLTDNKEAFIVSGKTTSLQTQSSSRLKIRNHCSTNDYQDFQPRKIASGMQQRLASLMFCTHSTEPRNDEVWCEGRKLQTFQRGNLCGY